MPTALQDSWVSATANAVSVGVALPSIPLPGSLIVVFTEYDNTNGNPTITDNLGDAGTWATRLTAIDDAIDSGLMSMHHKIVGTPSGGNKTVTMTCASTGNKLIFAGVYYNPSADLSTDGSAVSTINTTAANPTLPAITTTNQPGQIHVGLVMSGIFSPTAGANYTVRKGVIAPFNAGVVEDRIKASGTSETISWTAASGIYSALGGSFKTTLVRPEITGQPAPRYTSEGKTATFSVVATGTGSVTYQWSKNDGGGWNTIGGATSAAYTTGTLTAAADNGDLYRCAITDTLGTITTDQTILIVNNPGKQIWRRQPSSRIRSEDLIKKRIAGVSQLVADDFFESAAGPTSYTLGVSGGFTFSGTAPLTFTSSGPASYTITPSGGFVLSGASAYVRGKVFPVSGGFVLAGAAIYRKGKVYIPSGGFVLGGSVPMIRTKVLSVGGGAVFSGSSPLTFTPGVASGAVPQRTVVGTGT